MLRSPRLRFCIAMLLLATLPLTTFAAERKPGSTAFLKSLIVPGWGQYSLGKNNTALAFFGTDLVLIGGMVSFNSYGRSRRDDYRAMAAAYAGVQGSHGHSFYVDVGNWDNVDSYNEQRLRDRDYAALYTSPGDTWAWDSDQHRSQMESTRIKSDRALNSILFLAGGLVLNHVASAIHAGRLAVRQQQKASAWSPAGWDVGVAPLPESIGMSLRFTHSF